MTRKQVEERLNALKSEFETGQKMLAELEEKRTTLTNTMLRIQGAMQVLQELLEPEGQEKANGVEEVTGA